MQKYYVDPAPGLQKLWEELAALTLTALLRKQSSLQGMPDTSSFAFRVWRQHVLIGVPFAAFLHSALQFVYDRSNSATDYLLFILHFGFGVAIGSVILIPVFSLQALLFGLLVRRLRLCRLMVALSCGLLQALLVTVWGLTVGIQPSIGGRFFLPPAMIGAGFFAGFIVALMAHAALSSEKPEAS